MRPSDAYRTDDERWRAVRERDPQAGDAFVYAVVTTGVACRPACPSRAPRRENVRFFPTLAAATGAGFRPCRRCHGGAAATAAAAAVTRACALLDAAEESTRMDDVARAVGMTASSLVRAFRARLGVTPGQYRRRVMASRARAALGAGRTVTDAIFDAGYSTSSRFYAQAGAELGMAPRRAARGGAGEQVAYAVRPTSLGPVGITWTARGVCDLFFVDDGEDVDAAVRRRWPAAARAATALPAWLERVVEIVERPVVPDVPLDVQGTAFQERVWQALRAIPPGETRTYAQVAAAVGAPRAVRAVGRAIGQNRIAVLVPCHRVVGSDGTLTGYRWGLRRKAELLRRERGDAAG